MTDYARRFVLILLSSAVLLLPRLAVGDPPEDTSLRVSDELKWTTVEIDGCQRKVDRIRRSADINLGLALAVGLLGIIVTGLQMSDQPSTKRVVAVVGLTISALTLIANQVYQGVSHQSLYAKCSSGTKILSNLKRTLNQSGHLKSTDPGFPGFVQVVQDALKKCDGLEDDETRNRENAALELTSSAFAAVADNVKDGPEWLGGRQADDRAVYFVGVAHGRDAMIGREESLVDARTSLRNYLSGQLAETGLPKSATTDEVASRASAGAGVVDTYAAFDQASGLVSYYTLLALDRRQLRRILLAAGASGSTDLGDAAGKLELVDGRTNQYETTRQASYACILDKTRVKLSPPVYEEFIRAREMRKRADQSDRDYIAATEALQGITTANPECYLCWYNLALAYQGHKEFDAALSAFKKAGGLEPALGCKDGSFYATYGELLLDTGHYGDALGTLGTAQRYGADHPYMDALIAAAKEKSTAGH